MPFYENKKEKKVARLKSLLEQNDKFD